MMSWKEKIVPDLDDTARKLHKQIREINDMDAWDSQDIDDLKDCLKSLWYLDQFCGTEKK
jgi:hypothetical protein